MEQQNEQAVRTALETLGLPGLRVIADPEGIAALEQRPSSALSFGEAVRHQRQAPCL